MKGRQPDREEGVSEAAGIDREGRIGDWWSEEAEKRASGSSPLIDWSTSPAIERITNRRVSGSEDRNWLGWIRDEFVGQPLGLGLSIGCGTGLLERDALAQGLCLKMEGLDIADGALEVARRQGAGLSVTYRSHNLESDILPRGRYDIVFSAGVLHHVYDLEYCLGELHAALKEDGLLVLSEFVGPARFQWTGDQLEPVSVVYGFLPWRYRYNHLVDGTVPYPRRPQICSMLQDDPSEAVRSNEMLQVVEHFFERIGRRSTGGTLLNPLLAGIVDNFDEEDELDLGFLTLAAEMEEQLINAKALPCDFVVDVYRRRPGPAPAHKEQAGRASQIKDQERQVEEALARAVKVRDENEEKRLHVRQTARKAGELGAEVSRLQAENAGLKSGLLFSAARCVRKLAGRRWRPAPRPDSPSGGGEPEVVTSLTLSSRSEACVPASAEAASVMSCVDGIPNGRDSLWLCWLREVAGIAAGRALTIGLEPAMVHLVRSLGVCERADVAETPELEALHGQYDLVILDLSGWPRDPAGAARAAASAVAEGGALVWLSTVPRVGASAPDGIMARLVACLPERWRRGAGAAGGSGGGPAQERVSEIELTLMAECTLEAERGFGTAAVETARRALMGRGPSGMERALACLLLYAETLLIGNAVLTPSFTVKVFRKGPGRSGRAARREEYDIIGVQRLEIERLGRMLQTELERKRHLSGELAVEVENLERATADMERLTAEQELLKKRGPARYLAVLTSRLKNFSGGR